VAKDGRLDHLFGGPDHCVETLCFREGASGRVLALGQMSQAILRDDDGAVDNEAKIERAETHQVRCDPAFDHSGPCEPDEPGRVGLHVILLLEAAEGVDEGDPRHCLELRTNDPILHSAQIGRSLEISIEARALGVT
jgi:hypothetical protein